MKFIVILVIILFSSIVFGDTCKDLIPKEKDWAFARQVFKIKDRATRAATLKRSCHELDTFYDKAQFAQPKTAVMDRIKNSFINAPNILTAGANAFNRLNNFGVEGKYKAEIEVIKKNPNRAERIQLVYKLVSKYQGDYGDLNYPTRNATRVLKKAQLTGDGGQCSDFASLLHWSLMQTSRPNSSSGRLGSLDENSYSVSYASGCGRSKDGAFEGCHKWVRVNLPFREAGRVRFEKFDLDTTWYREFTPVSVRQLGKSETVLKEMIAKCLKVIDCLSAKEPEDASVITYPSGS